MIADKKIIENLKKRVLVLESEVKKYKQTEKASLTNYKNFRTELKDESHEFEKYKNYFAQSREAIYCIQFIKPIDISLAVEEQINEIYKNAYFSQCNEAMAKMYAYNKVSDLVGKKLEDFHKGGNSEINRQTIRNFINSGYKGIDNETEETNIKGEKIYFINNDLGIIENGFLKEIWGTSLEISKQKIFEQQLASEKKKVLESEMKYKNWFDFFPHACFIWKKKDDDFIMVQANKKAYEESEGKIESIFGTPSRVLWKDEPDLTNNLIECFETQKTKTIKRKYHFRASGKEMHTQATYSFIPPLSIQIITQDITKEVNAENELIKAKDKAEESDRLKSAFLRNISHEIRTPMNAIGGFSELLLTKELSTDKQKRYSEIVNNSIQKLLMVIENMITIAHIETNLLIAEPVNLCPKNLMHDIFEEVKKSDYAISKTHIDFKLKLCCSDNLFIISDYEKLKQILLILLENAFKFTEDGFIEFTCEARGDNLFFTVKDSGIGIAKDKQTRILKSFAHANETITQTFGGVGLGLSIALGLIKLLKGDLIINSTENKGTEMKFSIPIEENLPNKKRTTNSLIKEDLKNTTILVVEDEEFNILYIREILENAKWKVLYAKTGREAIEKFKNNDINLILMDLKIPDIDGITATSEIRKLDKKTPIIAQTAYPFNTSECYKLGFNAYLKKPFSEDELLEVIKKFKV